MKYLIAIGLIVIGLTAGFFIGKNSVPDQIVNDTTDAEMIPEVIRDTIVETKFVEVSVNDKIVDSSLAVLDSTLISDDSLYTQIIFEDTSTIDEEISINREKLLRTLKIPISYLMNEVDGDTTIKELLGIEKSNPKYIFVELWQSPLNFEGYKLSKSKLILYGLSTQFEYEFYRKSNSSYLVYQDIYYLMQETQDFLPYLQVQKEDVFGPENN